ncbi:hypothetical protein [Streptomyces sp. NPDC021224]|uniref:hypothetical protein n=1 Tax=unclassified Streptomyces TaxID=2593676 RepID=UPI0037A050F3
MTSIDAQRTAIALLAEIADTWPDLPAPAVVLHQEPELGVTLRLARSCDLEAWREVLDISPELLVWHVYDHAVWMECASYFSRVRVVLHSDVPVAPHLAKVSPQRDAERRRAAALLVQRHEIADPAVPPLAVAPLAMPVAVRPLADALAPDADYQASVAAGYVQQPDWGPAPTSTTATVETGGAL